MKNTQNEPNSELVPKMLWYTLGIAQVVFVGVTHFFILTPEKESYSFNTPESANASDVDMTMFLVFAGLSVVLAIVGQIFFKKAHSKPLPEKLTFWITSWALAEAITIYGLVGATFAWKDIKYSLGFFASGLILWFIRKPTFK